MRDVKNPYEIWEAGEGDTLWRWNVLKKYQAPEKEATNPYARWFCAVESPITREQCASGYEMGDVYVSEIMSVAHKVQ